MYMATNLTPLGTSIYKRPFTHEGNYLVWCNDVPEIYACIEEVDLQVDLPL